MCWEAGYYAAGQPLQPKGGTAATAVTDALNYLIRNSFNKLGYLAHLSANPQAEIKAVLGATDVDDLGFSLEAGQGNQQALEEFLSYVNLMASANRQMILEDLVETRFGRRPYGWPEWEVVLLVVRLVRKGDISLVIDGATLTNDKIFEAVIAPSKWRRLLVVKRRSVDQGQLQRARHLAKEVFGNIAPDGEEALDAHLRQQLGGWRTHLIQYQPLAEIGNYPGSPEIADALGVIAKLLAESESLGLIARFLERQTDLHDLSDDIHELTNFYDTQRPTWEKLRKAHARFQLNRTWLDKDAIAAAALKRMKDILGAAAPYGMVKDAESLIQTVEGIDTDLVTKRRDPVLQRIDTHIARIEAELDGAQASSDLRNQCLHPLQTLRRQVEAQTSIAHINQAQQGAFEAADEAIDRIEAASKPINKPGIHDQPPLAYVKKRRIIQAARLAPKALLETQADVDGYLERLRGELEAAIANDERVEIR